MKDIEHPIFRQHPFCDKTCLYVDKAYTISIPGIEKDKSDHYLGQLFDHIARPDFVYRHKWQVGDLLIWDNCATQHLAISDYGDLPRRLHRAGISSHH